MIRFWMALAAAALLAPLPSQAQDKVSFSKQIMPIFREQCSKCHGIRQPQGAFSVASYELISKGGKNGKSLAPKAEDSRLYKYLTGEIKPQMPIGGSLSKAELATVKAWIDQGARPDVPPTQILITESSIPTVDVPKIVVKVPVLPQVGALAWSADGKQLAVGSYKTVRIYDPATGQLIRELPDHADIVQDIEFSRSGTLLAAAGGPPAQRGEVKIWETATGKLVKTIAGHDDYIYSVAWGADDKTLATASYDKLIKLWNVETGAEEKTLKDHADAVYGLAFNPPGNLLASSSADRSVKVWDVASGKRIYTLSGHGDIVFAVDWAPGGSELISAGADKTLRAWKVNAQAGNQARSTGAHGSTLNDVAYSTDGKLIVTAGDDKSVKIWDSSNGAEKKKIEGFPEGILSVTFNPDGTQIAVGGFNGEVNIYNAADGALVKKLVELPKPKTAASAAAPAK